MIKPLLALTICFFAIVSYAQEDETRTRKERLPFYTPLPKQPPFGDIHEVPTPQGSISGLTNSSVTIGPNSTSPETGMANTIGNIPINYYTGSANITIPIYTLSEGNFSLPIYLMYNSTGIRAGELASSVGLGWLMEGIPRLTRVVRGAPDEGRYYGRVSNQKGFYEYGYELAANPSTYGSEHDGESDWYYFSINGSTHKFVFDAFKKAHFFPESDIKVVVETIPPNIGYTYNFSRFDIITPDGITYRFSAPESIYSSNLWEYNLEMDAEAANNSSPISSSSLFTKSAWQIDKIISPYGQELKFKYYPSEYSYYKLAEQSTEDCNVPQNKLNRVFVKTSAISEIEGMTTVIRFDKGDGIRLDLESFSASTPQNQTTTAPKVSSVKVYHKNASGALSSSFLEWKFNYDYLTGTLNGGAFDQPAGYTTGNVGGVKVGTTHRRRMILTSLENPDGTQYDFDYHGKNFNFKTRFTYGVDDWGYMNGYDGNINNFGLIGKDEEYPTCGSIRTSNLTFMKYGSLNKISTNQGLEVSFEYEANRAANFAGGTQDIGGLRIKKITTTDNKRGVTTRKEYEYLDGTTSSGFLILKPIYTYNYYAGLAHDLRESSLYGALLSETGGATVGYSKVKETVYSNNNTASVGFTVYTFDHTKEEIVFGRYISGIPCPTPSGKCYIPQNYLPSHNFRNGLPLKTEIFNQAGLLVSSSNNTYTMGNGIQQEHITRSRKGYYYENRYYTRLYDLKYYQYRLESVQTITKSPTGLGSTTENLIEYVYKDEMPLPYRNIYSGKHNQVSKILTSDEEGNIIETQIKYVADFEFDHSVAQCSYDCEINGTCDTWPPCWNSVITTTLPPSGTDSRGLFELKNKNILAAPVETIQKINGKTVSVDYQTYHNNLSPHVGLPKSAYKLRKSPKSNYQEVYYNTGIDIVIDADIGPPVMTHESYNTYGYPMQVKQNFGETKEITYKSGIVPYEVKSNADRPDELASSSTYTKSNYGILTNISPNYLFSIREFDDKDRPAKDKHNSGSIVNLYNYQPVPSEGSSISWNEFGFTKQCMGGNVVLGVSVNSLTSTAIAQFSTDGGVNWANANVGKNGFSYTRLPGSGTQEILARASDAHSHVITTYREISCGAPIPFGWGNNVVLSTGDSNVCRYDLQVVGLSTGGVAQFSIDNFASFYTATAPDIEKATYYLLKAPSTQQFWARDSNNPSNVITVTLNVCQP